MLVNLIRLNQCSTGLRHTLSRGRHELLTMVIGTLVMFAAVPAGATTTDQTVAIPAGWKWERAANIAGTESLTVVPLLSNDETAGSILVHGPGVSGTVPMPGLVQAVEVSPTSNHVLVRHGPSEGVVQTTLVERVGRSFATSWTVSDGRLYSFSTSGTALQSLEWTTGSGDEQTNVEVLDLSGNQLQWVSVSRQLVSALTVGHGESIIAALPRAVFSSDVASRQVAWQYPVGVAQADLVDLVHLPGGHAALRSSGGGWTAIDLSGARRFSHHVGSFLATYPSRSWSDYSQHRAYAVPGKNAFLLYEHGNPDGLVFDLDTGALTDITVTVHEGASHELAPGVHGGRLVFVSSSTVLISEVK